MCRRLFSCFVVFLSTLVFQLIGAENWPQFRGSNAVGIGDGQNLPTDWQIEPKKNIRWVTPIKGVGHSSPIVWKNRIYVTSAEGYESNWHDDSVEHSWKIYALDSATGKILWENIAHKGKPKTRRHEKSSQANSTPVTDGNYVAAIFGSEGLFVYNAEGKLLWTKDLGLLDPGLAGDSTSQWGHASSPILYKDHLIVQIDKHADSFLAAYRINDGKEIWRTPRPDELPSWSTPSLFTTKSHAEIITNGQFIRGYDAETGKEIWRFSDAAEVKQPTPLIQDDKIIFTGGYPRGRPIYALRTGGQGTIKEDQLIWKIERGGPYTPTPIVYKGFLYTVQNNGILAAYDLRDGAKKYESRLDGDFSASPVASDDHLFFASEDGTVSVVKAGPEFNLVSKIDMETPCFATPAISNKTIYIRTLDELYAIGKTN
jgi:outer membrane protein assembly factor BamB